MIDTNVQSVSVREFAKQVGKSKSWISRLAVSGRLPRNEDGSIPLEAGFKAYDKFVKETEAKKRKVEPLPDDDNAPMAGAMNKAMNVTEAFNKARLAEKTYQAKLKELEYKLKHGELVERTRVIEDAQATGALLREQLMSIPVRYSGMCEGRTARDIEEILEGAINDALKALQKSEFIE